MHRVGGRVFIISGLVLALGSVWTWFCSFCRNGGSDPLRPDVGFKRLAFGGGVVISLSYPSSSHSIKRVIGVYTLNILTNNLWLRRWFATLSRIVFLLAFLC